MPVDSQMRHLNANALCAIAIDVTGNDGRLHDIIEICVMPLDNFIKASQHVMPYYQVIAPFRPENIEPEKCRSIKVKLQNAVINGLEPSLAADRFEEWFQTLILKDGKKIVPLAMNWPLLREFFVTWLGTHTYNSLFHETQYRDIMHCAMFHNDKRNHKAQECFYPRPDFFTYIAHQLGLSIKNRDDVMEKALVLAEIYRLMMKQLFH